MDLQNETSAFESVEDNELATDLDIDHSKDKVKTNGSCSNEIHNIGTSRIVDSDTLSPSDGQVKEGAGIEQAESSANSQPLWADSSATGSSPVTKGYGLRKWRRIKRDKVKDASANADSNKVLKRVLSISGNPGKATNLTSAEIKHNSEGSAGSANMLRNMGVADGLLIHGSGMESRFALGSAFAPGTDSENSEDRSSKSSTAASAPRMRYDLPAVLGYMREKNRKNLSGKTASSSAQRAQQGKGQAESSKKPRGERVKIEKENSHSSIESDSRSSNFVFLQGACSVTSNGNKKEREMFCDGENSDDAHAGEQQFGEEVHAEYIQENVGEDGVSLDELAADASWEVKEEKSKNHRSSADEDPLVESIHNLQSLQEALESEVQQLQEIGRVSSIPIDSTFLDQGIHESSSSEQFDAEKVRQSSFLESQVLSLTENVKHLETRLKEAEAMLKVKEFRIAELESTLICGKLPSEESGSTTELQQERCREIETELESVYKQKIEAEVEYLTLSRTMQKLIVAAGDQITLFEQQEALVGEQTQMLNKLGEAERKAAMLKKQAEELGKSREDILETEEVLKMQRRVCKVTFCFFIQLVLIFLVFLLVVLPLSPRTGVVVPT